MNNRHARLSHTIYERVIPRLVNSDLSTDGDVANTQNSIQDFALRCTDQRIQACADECLLVDGGQLESIAFSMLETDESVEQVSEQLLGPIARELGDRWLSDQISFVDVHLGVLKLQSLAQKFQDIPQNSYPASEVIAAIASTPGDQHTFGVSLACDCFERKGWDVTNLSGLSISDWMTAIEFGPYNVVGLSLSTDAAFGQLCEAIRWVRTELAGRSITIIVSGDYFVRNPEKWVDTGADFCSNSIEKTLQDVENNKNTIEEEALVPVI